MKLKYSVSALVASAIITATLPLSAFAATKVSQSFSWNFTYFSLADGGAVAFSDGKFYQSSDPSSNTDWLPITIESMDTNSSEAFLPAGQAVKFKHHDYVISGATVSDALSIDTQMNEIMRINNNHPNQLRTVHTLNENYFRDLVVFKDRLFASDSSGAIWKTLNGKDWHKLTLTGLPNEGGFELSDLVAGTDTLFAVNSATETIYTSMNGKAWSELTGAYQNHTYTGSVSVAEFSGKTYVATYSHQDGNAFVWKVNSSGNFIKLFEKSNDLNYELFEANDQLYLTSDDGKVRTLHDDSFTVTDTVNGQVNGVVTNNNENLFIVNHNGNMSLWK